MKSRHILLAAVAALVLATPSFAGQSTVFLVRHAERADTVGGAVPTMNADPDLSEAGHARARALAAVLKDAGITSIFVTDRRRTQQTAAPLAKLLGLTPIALNPTDTVALVARLKNTKGNTLVVGHSNTVPDVIKAIGVAAPVTIGDAEFDNLFIVDPSKQQLLRLHFQ